MSGTAANAPVDTGSSHAPEPVSREGRRLVRYLGTPLLVGAAMFALYLYMSSLGLDSIEQRRLNPTVIRRQIETHLYLVSISTAIVLALMLPLGVALTRPFARRFVTPIVGMANIAQATPSLGVMVLVGLVIGFGTQPAIVALVAYSALPILRNTMVGLHQVDEFIIESGRGMGLTKAQVLFGIELPLAVPVMLAGVRTALIINTGTATLATFIGGRGLGGLINTGLSLGRPTTIAFTGAVIVAGLALMIDWLAGIAEDVLSPRGL
ncbi:MAG: ABC transporter permease [Egibacteraceae bacterium]